MFKNNSRKETAPISQIDLMPDFIRPLIRNNGQLHDLEKTYKEDPDEMPEMTAVGCIKLSKDKNHSWINYTVKFKGDKVSSIEVSEPDMRAIAEEGAKIAFVSQFTDQDL